MQLVLDVFLTGKLKEVNEIGASASLNLGKIFTEVAGKYANKGNGIYTDWLVAAGFNPVTAMNHRKRYNLYTLSRTKKGKDIIKNAKVEEIKNISSNVGSVLKSVMKRIDKGEIPNRIKELEIINVEEKKKKKSISLHDLEELEEIMNIDNLEEINKYKNKIAKILRIANKAEEVVKNKLLELENINNLKLDNFK